MIGSGVRFKNTRKRGLEGKTGPKQRRFGLFLFLKEQAPKRRHFGRFFFLKKRNRLQNDIVLARSF